MRGPLTTSLRDVPVGGMGTQADCVCYRAAPAAVITPSHRVNVLCCLMLEKRISIESVSYDSCTRSKIIRSCVVSYGEL